MKLKKLLSIMTATALSITMCLSTSIFASADVSPVDVSTAQELHNALVAIKNDTDHTGTINLTKDITTTVGFFYDDPDAVSEGLIYLGNMNMNVTLNLNGHALTSNITCGTGTVLTVNGGGGSITGCNIGDAALSAHEDANINIKNTVITGGSGEYARYGIYAEKKAVVMIDNCLVKGGDSTRADGVNCVALYISGTELKVCVQNSTFETGNSINNIPRSPINADEGTKLYDFSGEEISATDFDGKLTKVDFGTGFIDNSKTTTVTAKTQIPTPTYTVTIPSTVDFGDVDGCLEKYRNEETDKAGKAVVVKKDFDILASGVNYLFHDDDTYEPTLTLSVNYSGKMIGETTSANILPYTISKTTAISANTATAVGTFKNDVDLAKGEANKITLTASINRADIKTTDKYIGTLTFTVARTLKEAE